jgi:hypothetical protein
MALELFAHLKDKTVVAGFISCEAAYSNTLRNAAAGIRMATASYWMNAAHRCPSPDR